MLEGKKVKIKVGGDFEPVPMDKYTVQISDVSLVTQFNKFKGIEEEMLNYQFTILDEKPMPDGEDTTRGRLLWQRCSMSISARSKLGKLAVAVYGRELTKEEQENFDAESIVGKFVDVMVTQNPSKDGNNVFNNIVEVSKNIKPLAPVDAKAAKPTGTIQKKTVPAVAPDAQENPDEFINQMEQEAKNKTQKAPEVVEESPEELEAAAAEAEAAELAAKAARARANAAKKKAALGAASKA